MTCEMLEFVSSAAREAAANREAFDARQPVVIEENMLGVGQMYPQGDVALLRLAALPADARRLNKKHVGNQVVEGNTQGARHCWDSLDGVEIYLSASLQKNPLCGHIYRLTKTRTLTHPEHAHQTYWAGFVGMVVCQRSPTEELRRMRD